MYSETIIIIPMSLETRKAKTCVPWGLGSTFLQNLPDENPQDLSCVSNEHFSPLPQSATPDSSGSQTLEHVSHPQGLVETQTAGAPPEFLSL